MCSSVFIRVYVSGFLDRNLFKSTGLNKKMLIADGIGVRLREERERLALNQTDFGALGGVSRGTQKAYELESSSPDVRYLKSLESHGVDCGYVLTAIRAAAGDDQISDAEARLLSYFRQLPDSDRAAFERMAHGMALAATMPRTD